MLALHPASPQARAELVLGIIGGSGVYRIEGLEHPRTTTLDTPYGAPSAPYTEGTIARERRAPIRCVFLPRHGVGHVLLPSEIPARANIHGFKQLGVTHLVGVSAVGSLREQLAPGHLLVPDQLIDRTYARASTFFGNGCAAHVPFGEPTCSRLSRRLVQAADAAGVHAHDGGTCVVIEGPAFSTRAESELYRQWGASAVGMTALPEAKLAREAEIAYSLLMLVTDYDCWYQHAGEVSVEAVVGVLRANTELANRTIARLARDLPERTAELPYPRACENAVMTATEHIPPAARSRLDLIIGHYLG